MQKYITNIHVSMSVWLPVTQARACVRARTHAHALSFTHSLALSFSPSVSLAHSLTPVRTHGYMYRLGCGNLGGAARRRVVRAGAAAWARPQEAPYLLSHVAHHGSGHPPARPCHQLAFQVMILN